MAFPFKHTQKKRHSIVLGNKVPSGYCEQSGCFGSLEHASVGGAVGVGVEGVSVGVVGVSGEGVGVGVGVGVGITQFVMVHDVTSVVVVQFGELGVVKSE
mgnify:CR=1 FL=1